MKKDLPCLPIQLQMYISCCKWLLMLPCVFGCMLCWGKLRAQLSFRWHCKANTYIEWGVYGFGLHAFVTGPTTVKPMRKDGCRCTLCACVQGFWETVSVCFVRASPYLCHHSQTVAVSPSGYPPHRGLNSCSSCERQLALAPLDAVSLNTFLMLLVSDSDDCGDGDDPEATFEEDPRSPAAPIVNTNA